MYGLIKSNSVNEVLFSYSQLYTFLYEYLINNQRPHLSTDRLANWKKENAL